jgi:uncharacterized membrane protein YidH (DUF202 family)
MKLGVNLIIAVILEAHSSNREAQSKESKISLKKDYSNTNHLHIKNIVCCIVVALASQK